MTSQLAYIGVLMLVFGLGSFYATEHFAAFNIANVLGGTGALIAAAVGGLRRIRIGSGPHARRVISRGVLTILIAIAVGAALERAAHYSNIQYDWTFERRFELSEATQKACSDLGSGLRATLYHDPSDPRTRRTRLLLRTLALECDMEIRSEHLDHDSIDGLPMGVARVLAAETASASRRPKWRVSGTAGRRAHRGGPPSPRVRTPSPSRGCTGVRVASLEYAGRRN